MCRDALFLLWTGIIFVSIGRVNSERGLTDVNETLTSTHNHTEGDDYHITGTKIEEYPYIVQVTKEGSLFLCFGTLISRAHILTSAYCLRRQDEPWNHFETHEIIVILGTTSIPLYNFGRKVKKIADHPKYQYQEGLKSDEWPLYDAAILTLVEPVKYSQNMLPIQIATPKDSEYFDSLINENQRCDTFVWNKIKSSDPTDMNIDKVSANLIKQSDCKKNILPADGKTEVCAFVSNNDQMPCRKNIGAPLVCNNNMLFGLHLMKKGCSELPDLFTRIDPLIDFITQNTEELDTHSQGRTEGSIRRLGPGRTN